VSFGSRARRPFAQVLLKSGRLCSCVRSEEVASALAVDLPVRILRGVPVRSVPVRSVPVRSVRTGRSQSELLAFDRSMEGMGCDGITFRFSNKQIKHSKGRQC